MMAAPAAARPYVPGWSLALEQRARAASRLARVAAPFAGAAPTKSAFSLQQYNRWPWDQGQVGSCHAHAPAKAFMIATAFAAAAGAPYRVEELSRWLVRYRCRELDGTLGTASDGGSIQNSLAALGPAPDGVGDCREATAPYRPDFAYLERQPPQAAYAEAGGDRITGIADVELGDAACAAIEAGHPVVIGMHWWSGMDSAVVTGVFAGAWGQYLGEHAVCLVGFATIGGRRFIQIENSHGAIYDPLPPAVAATIEGEAATAGARTTAFWVPEALLTPLVSVAQVFAGLAGFPDPVALATAGLL